MADTNDKPTLSWSQPAAAKPATTPTATPVKPVVTTSTTTTNTTTTAAASNTGTYVGIFVAGLIIGALIGWGITAGNSGNSSTPTTATSTAMTATSTGTTTGAVNLTGSTVGAAPAVTGNSGNVVVTTPQAAGFGVAVSKVNVTAPTWLVVYESHNGVPGNVIGAGLFFQGQTSGSIQLLRATQAGQSYFVGQSLDDGDKTYSLTADKPVRDSQGNPLFTEFTAQ